MGKATIAIGQTDITVTRSIARNAVKQLMTKTGFPKADIIFIESGTDSPRQLRNLFNIGAEANAIRTPYQNYVFVSYTDIFTDAGIIRSKQTTTDNHLIFKDPAIGLEMRPEYAETEMKLNIRFRCNDLTRLNGWTNAIRLSDGLGGLELRIDIQYDYSVPAPFLSLVKDSYDMQQELSGNKETLVEYAGRTFIQGTATRKNASGSHKEIIIAENQKQVSAHPDDSRFYTAKEITKGIFEVAMTLTFKYSKVIATSIRFPALIHNKFIPNKYIEAFCLKPLHYNPEEYVRPMSYVNGWLSGYPEQKHYFKGDGGSRMIEWDEFFPKGHAKHIQTVALFPIKVDTANLNDVFNLNEIPDEYVPDALKKAMVLFHDKVGSFSGSPVTVELYSIAEDERIHNLTVDDKLNITTNVAMDPTRRNYIRIGLFKDISRLTVQAIDVMRSNPLITLELLKLHDPTTEITDDVEGYHLTMVAALDAANLTKEIDLTAIDLNSPEARVSNIGLKALNKSLTIKPRYYRKVPSLLEVPLVSGVITHRSLLIWCRKQEGTSYTFAHLQPQGLRRVATTNISVS